MYYIEYDKELNHKQWCYYKGEDNDAGDVIMLPLMVIILILN